MTTIHAEQTRTEAVQVLFDGLMQFSRALRSRSGDWTNAVRDLSRGDIVTLGVVARQGSLRSSAIAHALGVDPSVVSRQLVALERLGLIARCADPADRRAELISPTPLGRERLLQARAATCEALAVRLSDWEPDAILRAATVVDDLAGVLCDETATTGNSTPDTRTTEDSKDAHV